MHNDYVQSIISIGSSSICDIGKGIQTLMKKGLKTVDELDRLSMLANADKDTSVIQKNSSSFCGSRVSADINSNKVDFHHFTVPTVICPHHSRSQWCALHKEDDVIVKREGVAPTVRVS